MGFFKGLKDTILKLNGDISDVANQEKAKKLRKNLIIWGASLSLGGLIGVLACFGGFSISGFNAVNNMHFGIPLGILIPFLLIIPCGIAMSIGITLLRLGFSILIAGVTTKFVDKSLNNRCACGYDLSEDDKFCPQCGRPIQIKCPNCGAVNDRNNKFCNNCGKTLK